MAGTKTRKPKEKASDNPVYKRIKRQTEKYAGSVKQIMDQYREFDFMLGEEKRTFRIYFASPEIEENVNRTYAKIYGNMLQDSDMLPEAQILENMERRGLWSDEKEKRIENLQERIARLQGIIFMHGENELTTTEMKKHADDFEASEKELNELVKTRTSFVSNSIEMRAHESKIKDQVWQCTKEVKEDGSEALVWDSLEAINEEYNRILLFKIINEAVSFWQGVPSDFLEDSPEVLDGESDTQ